MIEVSTKYKLHTIIRSLLTTAEIRCQMSNIFGNNFMSDSYVEEWYRKWCNDVYDEYG